MATLELNLEDFSKEELINLILLTHEKDVTFNQMIDFSKTYVEENRIVLVTNLDVF